MIESITDPLPDLHTRNHKHICVVGAGANGLAVLKVLASESPVSSEEWTVICFEEREDVGGIWRPAPVNSRDEIPVSALYESLTTNIPHPVMAYPSYPFPPETPLFPTATTVLKYLEDYTKQFGLRRFIRFGTAVAKASWCKKESVWKVLLSSGETIDFDTIIVSNGHYRKPRYPDIPGLKSWLKVNRAIHSAWYRSPDQLKTYDKIIVVGGGPSAHDLCVDLAASGKRVIHSIPAGPQNYPPDTNAYRKVPRIARYEANSDIVFFQDGTTETGVDMVVLATGYQYSFPFFSEPDIVNRTPELPPPFPTHLHNSSYGLFPLAKHLFPMQSEFPVHSIAFTGLAIKVAPFPVFEDQARTIVHFLGNTDKLDVAAECVVLVERAQRIAAAQGSEDPAVVMKAWNFFTQWEGFEYRTELSRFVDPERPYTPPEWETWMWERKALLRSAWVEIEKRGEASIWLKGVGANGVSDWFALCKRLLQKHELEDAKL